MRDEDIKNIYKQFSPDFFDLVIVDECHRGSAKKDTPWREILEYFKSALSNRFFSRYFFPSVPDMYSVALNFMQISNNACEDFVLIFNPLERKTLVFIPNSFNIHLINSMFKSDK